VNDEPTPADGDEAPDEAAPDAAAPGDPELDPSVQEYVSSGAADAAAADAASDAEHPADDAGAVADPVAAAAARRAARGRSTPRGEVERPVSRTGGGGAVQFVRECIAELRRVQWPDRSHLWQATAVVLVTVAVVGVYLYGLDSIFKQASNWLIDKQAS
jgi:preprotein translocase subunit SecE